jgi:hypothetical protein
VTAYPDASCDGYLGWRMMETDLPKASAMITMQALRSLPELPDAFTLN